MTQKNVTQEEQNKSPNKGRHLIARGTIFLMIGQASTVIGGLIVHVVGSRTLSYQQYSQFVLAFSVTIILQLILTSGFPQTFSFLVSKSPKNAWYIIRRGSVWVFLLSSLVFGIYALFWLWIGGGHFDGTPEVMIIAALVLPPIAVLFSILGVLNGLQLFLQQSLITALYYLLRAILISLLFVIMHSVNWGLLGNTCAAIISLFLVLYLTGQYVQKEYEAPELHFRDAMKTLALPTTIYGILQACLMSLDVWLANWFLQSDDAQAIFSCAYTISRLFFYGTFAIAGAIFSPLVQAISANDQKKIQDILSKAILLIEFTVLAVTVGITLYPDLLIRILYPDKYLQATTLLPILAGSRFLISILLIVTTWLLAEQQLKACVFYNLGGCLLAILLGYWGFVWKDSIGLAWGYLITCACITIIAVMHLAWHIPLPHVWGRRNIIALVIASGLSGVCYWSIKYLSKNSPNMIPHILGFTLIIAFYPALGLLFGILKKEDFNFIRSFLKK